MTGSIHGLNREQIEQHREFSLAEAIVARTVPDTTTMVKVYVPGFDKRHLWGPMPYMPRVDDAGETVLPQSGDRALVGFTLDGEAWMIGYWPGD